MLKMVGVETFYGKVKALHGVSLDVKEGQLVTILGANGAGKSTILKTISGLVEPENGTIHFNDIRIDRKDPEDIVAMGISHVPEWRRIFPELTVYENLIMGGFLIKEKDLLQNVNYIIGLQELESDLDTNIKYQYIFHHDSRRY